MRLLPVRADHEPPRNSCVRFVFGVAAASRNTRFQAARYGPTWAGLAPADRASFAWRLPSLNHLVGEREQRGWNGEASGGKRCLGGSQVLGVACCCLAYLRTRAII
jgi:hypothetical protein